jgi:Ricin-type beta-trefoil lectin domain
MKFGLIKKATLLLVVAFGTFGFSNSASAAWRFKNYAFQTKSINIAGSPTNFKQVNLFDNTPNDSQQLWWPISPTSPVFLPGLLSSGTIRLASKDNTNFCVNLTYNVSGNGVTVYQCTNNDAGQKIVVETISTNPDFLVRLKIAGTNLCINAPGSANYTQLNLATCTAGVPRQQWIATPE